MNFSSSLPSLGTPPGEADALQGASSPSTVAEGSATPLLLQYWNAALRWKFIIAAIIAFCATIGLILTLITPSRFTALAEIEISRDQKQITKVEGLDPASAGQDLEFYATQYALVKARPVAERVARQLQLVNNPAFFEAHGLDVDAIDSEFPRLSKLERQQMQERKVVRTLLDQVSISPVRTSRLVDISYTSRSPELSAKIANAWAASFIETSMDRKFASTADARKFLEERLTTLRQKVEDSEREVVNYASSQGIVRLDETRGPDGSSTGSRTLVGADLDALNKELISATAARIAAESRANSRSDMTTEAVTNDGLSALRRQRAEVASTLERQSVIFEPGYPEIQQLKSQLSALDRSIAQESSRIGGSRVIEYDEALAREQRLRAQVNKLKGQLDRQQRDSIQFAIFQREADTNRQLYDALLQRYKEIGIAGTVGASNISIVESAETPLKPSGPSLITNLLLSILVGVALAGGAVFALEHLDEGIRDPAQVRSILKMPLLGHTPAVDGENILEQIADAKSHYYEAYFAIETNLSFVTSHGFPKTMAVTSTQPAEGKSSTALALAVVLGRTGKRVLLVDADMRSPSIHTMVGRDNRSGLSNYLAGEDRSEILIQDTDHKGVMVMPAGPQPPSAVELLSSGRFQRLLKDGQADFDHLIIDSPPVLGLSDAPLIARACEGCIFVVRSETTALRAIRASIARLAQINVHIFGAILTRLQQKQGGYGYGYGYGYGQHYGEEPGGNISE